MLDILLTEVIVEIVTVLFNATHPVNILLVLVNAVVVVKLID